MNQPIDDTAMKGDIRHPVHCSECGLLSPLIPNCIHFPMGLDLMPKSSAPEASIFPRGMVHPESEPCPYKDDNNPTGVLATCCSFRGNETALYLIAMGMGQLALRLFEDKLPEEAIEFADDLRSTVATYRKVMLDALKRAGEPADSTLAGCTAKVQDVGWEFSIEKALHEIEACAKWHEKSGKMLCSTKAWF